MKTLFVYVASLLSGAACSGDAPAGAQVDVASVLAAEDALIIDVRTPGEFAGGHARGAINIPLGQFDAMAAKIGAPGRPTVVYCRSGARSGRAMRTLRERGFTHVVNGGGLGAMNKALAAAGR